MARFRSHFESHLWKSMRSGFRRLGIPTAFLFTVLVCLLSLFFLVMASEYFEEKIACLLGVSEKFEILKFLGIGMGGVLLALQALASHKRAKAMEDVANAQAGATKATEQGQRQQRLKNAIEHLGHDAASVRLGGAYEILHLAQDTKELRQTVLDILCVYIRGTTGEESEYRAKHKSKPSEEVQSLLSLLFVQEHQVFNGLRADLQGSWLNGANLRGARLQRAFLGRAYLKESDLSEAKMYGSNLHSAHLQCAKLIKTEMQGSDIGDAHLQCADLYHACLQGSDLSNSKMHMATLSSAQLQGARISGMGLHGARLTKVKLQGAGSADWDYSLSFAERIRKFVGQETDLDNVFFKGGLSQDKVDSFAQDLPDNIQQRFRDEMRRHISDLDDGELPERCNAKIGSYDSNEAEQWIAEYESAMSEVPKTDFY